MAEVALPLKYGLKSIDILGLANLLTNLSPQQKEALELLLDKKAMAILKESEKDIKEGRTISIEKWQ